MDGNGYLGRIPNTYMTGCCVIMLELENNHFIYSFSDEFIPGVHYIKVEYTFNDTVEEIDAKIQKALDKLTTNKTTIVIAHRLSTILNSDNIYVVDNGKIIDSGKHDDLLNNSKIYKNFYQRQLKQN